MAKTELVPRWPLTENCCVKLAAPFVSVVVPAPSVSSWVKSRLLSGRLETCLLESWAPFPSGSTSAGLETGAAGAVAGDCPAVGGSAADGPPALGWRSSMVP